MGRKPKLASSLTKDAIADASPNREASSGKKVQLETVFLKCQADWVADKSLVMVWEKSRRIGATWADACKSVTDAIKPIRPCNTYYIGTSKEMTMDYLIAIAFWAKIFNQAAKLINIELVEEVMHFRVRFTNGREIVGLSSRPSSLRGKDGNVVIDECAFLLDFPENRKAAQAILIWGRQIRYISTHNGLSHPFNTMVQDVVEGRINYSHHRTTFREAIEQGLFKKVCQVSGQEFSLERQKTWEQEIRDLYGIGASEELDCIPSDFRGGGLVFKREYFRVVNPPDFINGLTRYWDIAATPVEVTGGCYTASVLMGRWLDTIYVMDVTAVKLDIAGVNGLIHSTALSDGRGVSVRWEKQAAAAGKQVDDVLRRLLVNFDAREDAISGNKLARAKPAANASFRGEIVLVRGHWNRLLIDNLYAFDGSPIPLVADITDAFSGCYGCVASSVGGRVLVGTSKIANPFASNGNSDNFYRKL